MRLALCGNTNNVSLALAMELRRRGVDAVLFLMQSQALHRPENVVPEWAAGYPDWIRDFSAVTARDLAVQSSSVERLVVELKDADAVILNHLGPSLLAAIAPSPSIAHLTGSDLDFYASADLAESVSRSWSRRYRDSAAGSAELGAWRALVERQRCGIRSADSVSYFPRGAVPLGDAMLDEIGVEDDRRFFIYFADDPIDDFERPPRRERPVLFDVARLTWKRPVPAGASELDYKGTDIFLSGVQRYLQDGGRPIEVRLVEKGLHINETRHLVHRLGLDQHVKWLPEMNRRDFRRELLNADIVADQFDSSVVGMGGLEAMAVGRPLLASADIPYWTRRLGKPPPICNAFTPQQVAAHLEALTSEPARRESIGLQSREFIRKYWSVRAAADECLIRLGADKFVGPSCERPKPRSTATDSAFR